MRREQGHPAKLRETLVVLEAAGFTAEATEARAWLPDMAAAFLATCIAKGDYSRLCEAVIEASAAGLSCTEARAMLQRLARSSFMLESIYHSFLPLSHLPPPPPPLQRRHKTISSFFEATWMKRAKLSKRWWL